MKIPRGLYQHLRTKNLYFVDGIARDVINPNKSKVVYTQLYDSQLRGTNTVLPNGSMWLRDIDDFNARFTKVEESKPERFIRSLNTALIKDIMAGYNKD